MINSAIEINNFDLLKQRCPMLTIEQWGLGTCKYGKGWRNNACYQYCPECISARHAKLNKNGETIAYGDRYCVKLLAEDSHQNVLLPFAYSELLAMRKFIGYAE